MSSSNKTANLQLNSWIGTDRPMMADYNSDNEKIDAAFGEHTGNMQIHLSQDDRARFEVPIYTGVYFGDGAVEKTIATGCPFDVCYALVFPMSCAAVITKFDTKSCTHYFAAASKAGSSIGLQLSGSDLVVKQSTSAAVANEFAALNARGTSYFYILFRQPCKQA